MNLLRCIVLFLLFATTTALGQLGHKSNPPTASEEPSAMVRSLYNEVVARHPVGIPKDADMKAFAQYLSKSLLHRIDLARACEDDYYRQHQNSNLKPNIEWLEFGLFSGGMENAGPHGFHILDTGPEKNGSFRVIVELFIIFGMPTNPDPSVWHVAVIVVREDGKFVVNDVIFLKDYSTHEPEFRLSATLASGCDGPRWVGHGKQGDDRK